MCQEMHDDPPVDPDVMQPHGRAYVGNGVDLLLCHKIARIGVIIRIKGGQAVERVKQQRNGQHAQDRDRVFKYFVLHKQ